VPLSGQLTLKETNINLAEDLENQKYGVKKGLQYLIEF
jgi:hypothetical protein